MPSRTPAQRAAQKDESRHDQWWSPLRCEHPDCDETRREVLKKCSACKMVMYCGKDHQKADWEAHKDECKVFRRLGIHATFYTDEDMLRRFPLRPPAQFGGNSNRGGDDDDEVPPGAECALCGKDDKQEDMTRTRCCNQVICDNSHQYELMSFSREYCERSHDRYTLCGYHGVERECDRTKDWRECPQCTQTGPGSRRDIADTLWRGLNSYNFCPLLSKDVPRHARCETCPKCHKKFISGVEGATSTPGYEDLCCLRCCSFA